MNELTFKVRGKWSDRGVACRIAMCLGVSNPLAWEDGDEGAPFWKEEELKWQLDPGNDYWLRKVVDGPVRTFKLNYRYDVPLQWNYAKDGEPPRIKALKGLCQWLECDLVFGE